MCFGAEPVRTVEGNKAALQGKIKFEQTAIVNLEARLATKRELLSSLQDELASITAAEMVGG